MSGDVVAILHKLCEAVESLSQQRPTIDPNGLVDIKTAARILRVHYREVVDMLDRKELAWVQRGRGRLVLASSVYTALRREAEQSVPPVIQDVIKHPNRKRRKRSDEFSDLGV